MQTARNLTQPTPAAPVAPPASAPPTPAAAAPASRPGSLPERLALALLLGAALGATAWHLPYYLAAHGARLRDPLHPLLKPSGTLGLAFGIAAFTLFSFLWLYPLRKKFPALAWTGRVPSWLRAHVVAGLSVPVLAAVHAGWRFDGLIGLGYLSMAIVCASGIVGRYLYVHIPRGRNGLELSLDEVRGERRALLTRLALQTGIEPVAVERALALEAPARARGGLLGALRQLVTDDLERWRAMRRLETLWTRPQLGARRLDRGALRQALALARREIALEQQVRALEGTRRLFALWHVAHRPFALTALVAVLVHVGAAVVFGAVGTR